MIPTRVTQSFAVINGQAVVLPANTVISRILVSGSDLVIIAADGSVYLIENGAQTPPTLVIDGLTIPSTALAQAITSGAEIQPAAGPESGSGAPGAPGSSGNNFVELDIGNIGDGAGFGGLLEGLELFFSGIGDDEPRDELPIEPVVVADDGGVVPVSAVLVEEDDLLGVISAFTGFEGFEGFEGGPIYQYNPYHVFSGFEGLADTLYDFADYTGFDFYDLFYPGTVGNLGGIVLFNYDFGFLEKFGGLGNDEDGSRLNDPNGLHATGSFNVGFVDGSNGSTIVFDPSLEGDSGLTSNGETVYFQLSGDGKTLYAFTYAGGGPRQDDLGDFRVKEIGSDFGKIGYGLVRPIFEIDIDESVAGGEYTVWLYNNLDHLPTVQGEEILPFNFPFIATDGGSAATETGVFQVQFQDDEPVLLRDVLEEFYNAFVVVIDDGPDADLSGFGWGIETIFSELIGFFGSDLLEDLPFGDISFDELPSFDQVYAFAQVFLGFENGIVDESLLDNLDRDVHLADFQIGGIDNGDNIEGSLGTHAGYRDEYYEFLEYLFSRDDDRRDYDSDLEKVDKDERRPDHDIESDGSVTTYGLLGALFGADAGDARSITFSADTAPIAGSVQLTSKGEDISYTISEDGTFLQAFASSGDEDEPRLVFEAELTDQIIGAFRFTLFDQIDHALPGEDSGGTDEPDFLENGIESGVSDFFATLEFLYDVTDSDGDTATGSFFVDVLDDEPYQHEYADYGDDGVGKQDDTASLYGHHGNMIADTAILEHGADQQLTGRFFVGADEPGNIAFDFTNADLFDPESEGFPDELPQSFNGFALAYSLSPDGRTLTARYAGLETETESDSETETESEGIVFTLTLNPSNLTYTFDLVLDPPPFVLLARISTQQDQSGLLDFSVPITGSDFDGDSFVDRISIRTLPGEYLVKGLEEEFGSALFEGGGSVFFEGTEYNDSILGSPTSDTFVRAGDGDDLIIAGGAGYNHFHGDDGDDILIGGDNVDDLYGDDGNDLLIGGDGEDNLYGGGGDDILRGGNHYDELYGGLGNDDLRGGRGDDVLRGGRGDDELRGGHGEDELHGGRGDDDLRGGRNNDDLRGGRGDDELRGGRGDDDLRGGRGDDFMDGGRGDDTAIYKGASEDYEIGVARDDDGNVIGLTVTDLSGPNGSGRDTLVDVENIHFERDGETVDLTDPVLLLDEFGAPVNTFTTIQGAVDAASDGFTVLINSGTYNESVDVTSAVNFKGVDTNGPVIVTPPSGSAFDIIGDLGATNTVSFDNIEFRGSARSGIQLGSGDILGELRVTNSTFAANIKNGVEVSGANLGYAAIIGSIFVGNGQPGLSSGDGDILFYQFNGDATLRDLQITGQDRGTGPQENGIQFLSDTGKIGNVWIDGVTIDGIFEKQPIAIFNYDDVNSLRMTNITVEADSLGFNTAINFDGVGGNIDLTNASQFFNLQFPNLVADGDVVALQGDDTDNELTGGDENNFLRGYGGDDVLTGNGGDDILFGDDILPGNSGNDMLFGGAGDDTLNGGAGTNELTGGTDSDVFLFTPDALDNLADQVLDYSLAEGDQVDLTTLFDVAGGDVADFVQYDDTTGALSVDADGGGAGASEVVATFTNTPVDIEVLFTDSTTPGDDTTIV